MCVYAFGMCMYIYLRAYIYVYTCVHKCTHTYIYIYTYIHMYIHMHGVQLNGAYEAAVSKGSYARKCRSDASPPAAWLSFRSLGVFAAGA